MLPFALLFILLRLCDAAPARGRRSIENTRLVRFRTRDDPSKDLQAWLSSQADFVRGRYADPPAAGSLNVPDRRRGRIEEPFDVNVSRLERRQSQVTTAITDLYASSGSLTTDVAYLGQASFGTPAQPLLLQLDTGSADLWVTSSAIQTSTHPGFSASSSSTYQGPGNSLHLSYGGGNVTGTLAHDTVSFAGFPAQNQTFVLATSASTGVYAPGYSGIIGMAFSSIAVTQSPTLIETLISENLLASQVFTFHFTRAADQPGIQSTGSGTANVQGGTLLLGGVDSSKIQGSFVYSSLLQKGFWQISLGGVSVNGQAVSGTTSMPAAIDSGTTVIVLPTTQAKAVAQAFGGSLTTQSGSTYVSVPCAKASTPFALSFGGQAWMVNQEDMLLGDLGNGTCVLAILALDLLAASGSSTLQAVIGVTFLKSVVSVFDIAGGRVGFALPSDGQNSTSNVGSISGTQSTIATIVQAATSTLGAQDIAVTSAATATHFYTPAAAQPISVTSPTSTGRPAQTATTASPTQQVVVLSGDATRTLLSFGCSKIGAFAALAVLMLF